MSHRCFTVIVAIAHICHQKTSLCLDTTSMLCLEYTESIDSSSEALSGICRVCSLDSKPLSVFVCAHLVPAQKILCSENEYLAVRQLHLRLQYLAGNGVLEFVLRKCLDFIVHRAARKDCWTTENVIHCTFVYFISIQNRLTHGVLYSTAPYFSHSCILVRPQMSIRRFTAVSESVRLKRDGCGFAV